MSHSEPNAFPVCYRIGGVAIGGQNLHVSLLVDPLHKKVTGVGRLSQAVNPPVNLTSNLHGTYCTLEVGPDGRTVIQLFAIGFPPALLNIGPLQPLQFPNLELWMTLKDNWDGGIAVYKYREAPDRPWIHVENVPVEKVDCFEG